MSEGSDVLREYLSEHDKAHKEWRSELETAYTEHDAELQDLFSDRAREMQDVFDKYDTLVTHRRKQYMQRCQAASRKYQEQLDDIFAKHQKGTNYNGTPVSDSDGTAASTGARA